MMLLVGGIPDIYHGRFKDRARKVLTGINFTSLPLEPLKGRRYEINQIYCEELIKTLVAYVESRPNCLDKGLGVVLLRRAWEKNRFENCFFPFALCNVMDVTEPIRERGEGINRAANIYAEAAFSAARQLQGPVQTLTTTFDTKLRRTPLLLPLRRFDSHHLLTLLSEAQATIVHAPSPAEAIDVACKRFVREHPFTLRGRGGIFENRDRVKFKAPGRENFHGRRETVSRGQGHDERCFLNSKVRLGGYFVDGFHYDCTRGESSYCGTFNNCHDATTFYKGRPHLNVYPDDFIR
ncbi:MAG: hypothetical protein ACREC0_14525 [Methylocella sp.]